LTLVAGLLALPCGRAQTWEVVLRSIRNEFPAVRQLTTEELARWLGDTNRPVPLLVDAREPAEFAVSHLRDAVRLGTVEEVKTTLGTNRRPVVVYCSVGYRSSALADELRRAGVTNVFNLEGSIFAWANEGRPVFRGAKRVNAVHPFDATWGRFLEARWHAK
jgi:rhodanese-related sulfurtransferase